MEVSNRKQEFIEKYVEYVKTHNKEPSLADINRVFGITRDQIRHYYGNITNLREQVREECGDEISKYILNEKTIFSKIKTEKLSEDLQKYNRFIITTAVSGKKLNVDFYNSIKKYCEVFSAKLIIIPCQDAANRNSGVEYSFPVELENESFVYQDTKINDNLFISSIRLSAKHIKPITGLQRIGQRNGSYIFASPKQFLEYVVCDLEKDSIPNAIMTTGAITVNDYDDDRYMSDRTSYIAENDHVYGAVVVERVDDKYFHFRQIQADLDGSFIDLGMKISEKEIETVDTSIVLGDLHCGEHDEDVLATTLQMLFDLSIENVFIHDMFSGYSISHYDSNSPHKLALKSINKSNKFMEEVEKGANILKLLMNKISGKIYRVKGNHDEWFERYLERAGYITDPTNHYDALEYARYFLEGKDPLKEAYSKFFTVDEFKNIVFLDRDQSYRIGGVELGQHGDLGLNGSKGGLVGSEKAYGDCVIGHNHSAAIHRTVYRVGTMTKKRLGYNKGPSNWTHTHCLVYNNGSRQLINIINGTWRI